MKYLLIATLISFALSAWAYHAADHAGDDFGAVFPLLGAGALSVVLTIVYVALAFWNHNFW